MRFRKRAEPSCIVSVVTFDELKRFGELHQRIGGWFVFNGVRIDGSEVLLADVPNGCFHVGTRRLHRGDVLIVTDTGSVSALDRSSFESAYERDPDWHGGPPAKVERRS